MSLLDIILRRKTVTKLRKTYDRLREKTDKEQDMNRRMMLLRSLDQIEPTIVALEEQIMPNFERRRMKKYVDQNLKRIKKMLKDKEYYTAMMQLQQKR